MEQVFIRDRKSFLSVEDHTSFDMHILGNFLTEAGYHSIQLFRKFLSDPWLRTIEFDYTYLVKIGNNVKIGCLHLIDCQDEEFFESTIDEIHDILNQWEELCRQEPKPTEIIITKKDGKIILESIN